MNKCPRCEKSIGKFGADARRLGSSSDGSLLPKTSQFVCPFCGAELWYEASKQRAYFYAAVLVPLCGIAYELRAWARGYPSMPLTLQVLVGVVAIVALLLYPNAKRNPGHWLDASMHRDLIRGRERTYLAIAIGLFVLVAGVAVWYVGIHVR